MPGQTDAPAYSTRLWSEEVARAKAQEGLPLTEKEPAYEFTGRTFEPKTNPYAD